jgi:O-antigen ligase
VPVYLLLARDGKQYFKYLLAGSIVSGPLYLGIALNSVASKSGLPASGYYHHITFGDAAMLNAVFLAAMLVTWKVRPVLKVVVAVSLLCALYASVLSQARGAWLALPFCGALLFYLTLKSYQVKIKIVVPVLLLVTAVIAVSPAGKVIESRVIEAAHEIESFASGEKVDTSVGGRLAMWDIALEVWREHPVLGTGPGDFDQEIMCRQSQGIYPSIDVHASVHNIYLQALATTGTVGFLILCFALLIQPARVFYRASPGRLTPAKLAGLMVIVAYAVFGLTESWILRAPAVSMFLIYLITLSVAASREPLAEAGAHQQA